jgi:hypothetical protein
VTSRYGKCHNIRENEIGESYTILSHESLGLSLPVRKLPIEYLLDGMLL